MAACISARRSEVLICLGRRRTWKGRHMRGLTLVFLSSASACSQWPSQGALRQPLTFCLASRGSDVIAKGSILAASPSVSLSFEAWPGQQLATPLSVRVERDLRGRLPSGTHSMFVGAPVSANGSSIETLNPSPIGVEGWLNATLVEGRWIFGLDGLVTVDTTSGRYETRLGSFADEASYEAAQIAAFSECPRVDYFSDDGGRSDWAFGSSGTSRVIDGGQ